VSHTFIVTTDAKGNVEHTYSWGNTPDEKNKDVKGKWYKDESEDTAAAQDALKNGQAEKVGDESLDPFVDQAFDAHANKENDPSNHRNGLVCNNCKTDAGKLVDEAKGKKKEADKKKEKEDNKNKSSAPSGSTEGICIGSTSC
jgi:hypothetical protein